MCCVTPPQRHSVHAINTSRKHTSRTQSPISLCQRRRVPFVRHVREVGGHMAMRAPCSLSPPPMPSTTKRPTSLPSVSLMSMCLYVPMCRASPPPLRAAVRATLRPYRGAAATIPAPRRARLRAPRTARLRAPRRARPAARRTRPSRRRGGCRCSRCRRRGCRCRRMRPSPSSA